VRTAAQLTRNLAAANPAAWNRMRTESGHHRSLRPGTFVHGQRRHCAERAEQIDADGEMVLPFAEPDVSRALIPRYA